LLKLNDQVFSKPKPERQGCYMKGLDRGIHWKNPFLYTILVVKGKHNMFFELKNIGAIKHANIKLGKLTIICGKNNTGKTYITYSIYGFLRHLFALSFETDNFNPLTQEKLNELSSQFTEKLTDIFSANADEFLEAKFHLYTERVDSPPFEDNSNAGEVPIENFPRPFILSSERTSIQLFQKELDRNRSDLVKALTKSRNLELLDKQVARFALPIEEEIDFARDTTSVIKSNSFLKQQQPALTSYIEDMLGVQYEIINGQILVIDKTTHKPLPHYMSSASVRTLFDLHLWLKHQAQPGDILFMDEPELNLHPENQLKMVRLLVRLVNSGINVFITTHSTYIIKEFNNLSMLANDFPEKSALMNEFGYIQDDVLSAEDLKAYIAHSDGTLSQVDIDEYGMIQSGFDDVIVQMNETSNKLISAIDSLLGIVE
jgi:AAA15 family ATPase/GTPase